MKHILYTTEEGGDFKYIAGNSDEETREMYQEAFNTGKLSFRERDGMKTEELAYIMLVEKIEDYDFVFKRITGSGMR